MRFYCNETNEWMGVHEGSEGNWTTFMSQGDHRLYAVRTKLDHDNATDYMGIASVDFRFGGSGR